jgi:Ras-related protein Rap-2C
MIYQITTNHTVFFYYYLIGNALAEQWDCPFIEASAKDRINVNEVFATIVREMNMTQEKRQKKNYCCSIL